MKTGKNTGTGVSAGDNAGFSLVELLMSLLILGILTASLFPFLNDFQRETACRSETQAVLDNIRIAIETLEKYIRQAGNDPHGAGFQGVTIVSDQAVTIRSDLKGSKGSDKGDPNGDVSGPDENVTLRFNPANQSVEIVAGGTAQIVCNRIGNLKFRYYDADGNLTMDGSRVRRIAVTISGVAEQPNPKTREYFGIELEREIRIFS
jgi:prepilin-type N-terminal cleavage/methylation domain-containing protein